MDPQGYPDEAELKKISEWPVIDAKAMMAFVKERWRYADWGWKQRGRVYELHTVGWSGNEDLIGAMIDNLLFHAMCWQSSKRGGHYVFELLKDPKRSKKRKGK
jgi:hypothetical protein